MKKMKEFFKKNGFYFYSAVIIIAVGLIIFHIGTAQASECHKNCKPTTTTVYVNDNDDRWKYVAGGIVLTCRAKAGYVGWTEGRWWTWCGEREKPRPLPNPGPVPNDVTPDIQPNRIIFK